MTTAGVSAVQLKISEGGYPEKEPQIFLHGYINILIFIAQFISDAKWTPYQSF